MNDLINLKAGEKIMVLPCNNFDFSSPYQPFQEKVNPQDCTSVNRPPIESINKEASTNPGIFSRLFTKNNLALLMLGGTVAYICSDPTQVLKKFQVNNNQAVKAIGIYLATLCTFATISKISPVKLSPLKRNFIALAISLPMFGLSLHHAYEDYFKNISYTERFLYKYLIPASLGILCSLQAKTESKSPLQEKKTIKN